MQESPAIPHWAYQILQTLATLGAGGVIVKLVTLYQNRQKPAAEVHESLARTRKTDAEAFKIRAEGTSELDSIIERLHHRIDQMQVGVDEIRGERDECRQQVELQKIELQSYETQMRRMQSIMDLKGIHLSDYDEPKQLRD